MAVALITSLSSRHVMIDGANNCHVRNINNYSDVNHADFESLNCHRLRIAGTERRKNRMLRDD